MAQTGDGSSGYVKAVDAIVATTLASPSFHFFYRNASAPGGALIDTPFSIQDSTGTYYFSFTWDHTSAGAQQAVTGRQSGGTFKDAKLATALTSNTWYGIGGSYDGTNVNAYLNGALETSTACTAFPTGNNPTPCALAALAGTGNFDDGTICEIGVWNVALTAAEFRSLGKGVSPLMVRPQSLVCYWPLIRAIQPFYGPAITSGGSLTVANHAPMIYPSSVFVFGENATKVPDSLTHALTLSDSPAVYEAYAESVSHTLTMSQSQADTSQIENVAHEILLASRPRVQGRVLGTGRHKERFDAR